MILLGADGMLGRSWSKFFSSKGELVKKYTRSECDITKDKDLESLDFSDVVINCAAYTNVDKAESEPDKAFKINVQAVEKLASRCANHGGRLIHFSTDYVFGGLEKSYAVSSSTDPINVYGTTKRQGEVAIQKSKCHHLIIRTSWLHALWGDNFFNTIIGLLKNDEEIFVVNDCFARPTLCDNLVSSTYKLLNMDKTGIWHITDGGEPCSWFEFASTIARAVNSNCQIKPCNSDKFPRPAPRPKYSVLGLEKTEQAIGPMPHWKEGIKV